MLSGNTPYSSDPARSECAICPVILTRVPVLKEICAVTVAIGLWNHVNVPQKLWNFNSHSMFGGGGFGRFDSIDTRTALQTVTFEIKNSTLQLPVPKTISDYINVYVEKLRYEIQDWVAYHHQTIFFGNGSAFYLYHHIPYFTWYPDGTINCKETARNLSWSLRLSEVDKYKFLCTYCIKDEVENLFPVLVLDNVFEMANMDSHPLIFYWNHYYRNALHTIQIPSNISLNNYMLQHQRVNNWWAKEYFFSLLNSQEKVRGAITLIDRFGVLYQKPILLKLSETDRVDVYKQRAAEIILNCFKNKTGSRGREFISIWCDICKFNVLIVHQFAKIFENLLESQNAPVLMTAMWKGARADFKYHISTCNDNQILGKIFLFQKKNLDNNEFLFTVLSDVNADIKKSIVEKTFFTDYCNALLVNNKLNVFDRLIKQCLPIHEFEKFKLDFIFSSSYIRQACFSYFSTERAELVSTLLSQLAPSRPDLVQQYKKDLLTLHFNINTFSIAGKISPRELEVIMANCLPTDDLKTAFKKRIIFSSSTISILQEWLTDHDKFAKVQEYVNYYLPSEEDRKELKKRIVINFTDKLAIIFSKYDLGVIDTIILRWCFENDQRLLLEFKSSLNVDRIFDTLLINAIFLRHNRSLLSHCTFKKTFEFVQVTLFLNWYFEFPDKVKQYKLKQINSYTNISVIKTLLKKKDESQLKIVMKWFFDNDLDQIEKFKKNHEGAGKILYVI